MVAANSSLAALLAVSALAAQQTSRSLVCGSCHTKEASTQTASSMAHALTLPGTDPLLLSHPKLSGQEGDYTYTIESRNGAALFSVTNGSEATSAPIRWAFGEQSQTYVLERDGHFYESMVSYYPAIQSLDTTIGDQRLHPRTVLEAMGRELTDQEFQQCVGCHSTGSEVDHRFHMESMKPGVQCERCHTGAARHAADIVQGKLDSVPPRLRCLSAEEMANFCGQCHRSWETVVRDGLLGKINVRFQPYRLANSKCFDGSDARISCVACHNPHEQVVRKDAAYDAKCLACHATNRPASIRKTAEIPRTCPMAHSNCVSCHMPKIALPGGHQIFTDHFIRVVRANESYPD